MDMVRRELDANPGVGLDELARKAKEIDPAIGELSTRQFHARYPLQVKRRKGKRAKISRKRAAKPVAAAKPASGRPAAGSPGSERDAIRAVFLQFASDFAKAESRQEIVGVLSSVDGYVDRVQKLVGR